jgi:hypothetical protein
MGGFCMNFILHCWLDSQKLLVIVRLKIDLFACGCIVKTHLALLRMMGSTVLDLDRYSQVTRPWMGLMDI